MPSRDQIAAAAAAKLAVADSVPLRALLGFDGFVDEIVHVVGRRTSAENFDRMAIIRQFGERILAAAGESANIELVTQRTKLGGNGPIMANALAALGADVTYIGAVGQSDADADAVHPVFQELATRAHLIPLAPPARTLALEFTDGKIMLGNLAPLSQISWERIAERAGPDRLRTLVQSCKLLGLLNWTMIPRMTEVWEKAAQMMAGLPQRPRAFIDLADPGKRDPADLRTALKVLTQMNRHAAVMLGLNLSEAQQVAAALNLPHPSQAGPDLTDFASRLRQALDLELLVIHPRTGAAAATADQAAWFAGPFARQPLISTGAGDHFNAGFALARALDFSLEESLAVGTAISGYYVRHAASPTRLELAEFLRHLPAPEEH